MQTLSRLLLLLYPPGFRRAHGREMSQCFRELAASQSAFALTIRLVSDLLSSVPREWWLEIKSRLPIHTQRRRRTHSLGEPMKTIPAELRLAVRLLLKNPIFTAAAVATLALGIGANTAMFSLAEATLLRPVHAANPDRLVALTWSSSYPDYLDYTHLTGTFSGVLAKSDDRFNLTIDGASELQDGSFVSGNAFSVLGVPAVVGRTLIPEDDAGPGAPIVGVVGYDYWRSRLGADPGVVGKVIRVNGRPVTIVGVAEQRFRGLSLFANPVLYLPLTSITQVLTGFFARPAVLEQRGLVWLDVVARLQAGVTREQGGIVIGTRYRQLHPPPPGAEPDTLMLTTVSSNALGGDNATVVRRFVFLLLGVVALTLLIGCANLANLLLARSAARRREVGVRLALGAGRGRIVREVLIENLVLGALGGIAGLYVAHVSLELLAVYQLPGGIDVSNLGLALNGGAVAIAAALSVLTGLLFGAAPAWRASSSDALTALRSDDRRTSARSGVRAALVAGQVAVSLVLLAGTGLFLRSLVHGLNMPLGFNVNGVATLRPNLSLARYNQTRARAYRQTAIDRVRALPGVTAAAWTAFIPTNGGMTARLDAIEGYTRRESEDLRFHTPQVGTDYFRASGTRIIAGRALFEGDASGAPSVVVNEAAAERYWAGQNALGGRIRASRDGSWLTVVGIAENAVTGALGEAPEPMMYVPLDQPFGGFGQPLNAALLVRTSGEPEALLPLLREQVGALDPAVPLSDLQPLEFHVRELVMPQRMGVTLLGFFSLLASSLATIGIYGVASYVTALRTREIGIRMALGADRSRIGRFVLVQGALPVAAGIGVGLVLALWSSRLAAGFMYDVKTWDPLTFGVVTLLMSTLALLATYVPARRAARIDPVTALRHE